MPNKIEKQLITIENKVIKEIDKKYRLFYSYVNSYVDKKGVDYIKSNIAEFKNELTKLMRKAGLNKFNNEIKNILPLIENKSIKYLAEQLDMKIGLNVPKLVQSSTIVSFNKINSRIFTDQKKYFNKKITLEFTSNLNNSTSIKSFVKALTKKSQAELHTLGRTTVQTYDNTVTTEKANELGLNKFRYAGAKDSLNRDFCSQRVGKIYTDKEAKKWDNGQLPPAYLTLGGYNCRHRKEYKLT